MSLVPLSDQIACVAREIAIREKAYPKFVGRGKMRQDTAEREIVTMRLVINTLKRASRMHVLFDWIELHHPKVMADALDATEEQRAGMRRASGADPDLYKP